ncbi:hypothetical protein EDB19DRAFT_2021567 [Suillus lakei]|nr:hypothetical protein EDB19DRAFT_2021567 [Suillus lakei]
MTIPNSPTLTSAAHAGTLPTIITQTHSSINGTKNNTGTMASQSLIPAIATLPVAIMHHGQEDSTPINNTISNNNIHQHESLGMTALDDDMHNVSGTHVLDANIKSMNLHTFDNKNFECFDDQKGHSKDNEPMDTILNQPIQNSVGNSDEKLNVFFVHPMPENPPMYLRSSAPYSSSVFPHTPPNSNRLTKSEAESFLLTEPAKYNDYHSIYIPNVIHAIESYCFCQDKLITNVWNVHLFHNGSYPGHPVISGGTKLPTGIETILSTCMLAEASMCTGTIKCDNSLHIKGGLTHSTYAGCYKDVNPFFFTIAEAHGEPELASKILDTLLMPFPDEDTISALTESHLLNVRTVCDILWFAFNQDLVLRIAHTGLVIVAISPFWSDVFEGYVLPDIAEEEEEPSKPKKFFL